MTGMSKKEIAHKLGMSIDQFYRFRKKHYVPELLVGLLMIQMEFRTDLWGSQGRKETKRIHKMLIQGWNVGAGKNQPPVRPFINGLKNFEGAEEIRDHFYQEYRIIMIADHESILDSVKL